MKNLHWRITLGGTTPETKEKNPTPGAAKTRRKWQGGGFSVAVFTLLASFSLLPQTIKATTRYVNLLNPAPLPPFTSWATAATNIQDAVDVAAGGDEIVVNNGVYQTGARMVYGMNNRVAVTRPVTVRSVGGPGETHIVGAGPSGATAVRCVYLTNGAVLVGFTLTNGATQTSGDYYRNQSGGGVWCEGPGAVVANCVLTGNSAAFTGGGAYAATLTNCTLWGNSASRWGGGAYAAALYNCTLTSNSAYWGGGVSGGTLTNCTLSGNSASEAGGGAWVATLNNCTLSANRAVTGGGAAGDEFDGPSILENCTLTGNSAAQVGGGAYASTLYNCTLSGNRAARGGGAGTSTYTPSILNNCTLISNSADTGGGAYVSTLNNCIVYYNQAPIGPNYYNSTLAYCCATPLPAGTGNLAEEPQLASTSHLSADSPCRGQGSATFAKGLDVDGEMWDNPPSIGCDEYWSGSVTGALKVSIVVTCPNPALGADFQAIVDGRVSASRWEFDDGTVVSNRPAAWRKWTAPGDYEVGLRAYNESYPTGVLATVTVTIPQVHYVALNSTNPVPPYTNWTTASTNIQHAVDVAVPGTLVWVADGTYDVGERTIEGLGNRVAVTSPITVCSVSGPTMTRIVASPSLGSMRCVYLTKGAVLAGFTLTGGSVHQLDEKARGGGVWCAGPEAVVSNCVLTANFADNGGGSYRGTLKNCVFTGCDSLVGGGAYQSILINCVLTSNNSDYGGGVWGGEIYNCTLVGNHAYAGGGAGAAILYNSIVYFNTAAVPDYPQNCMDCAVYYCCTTPLPLPLLEPAPINFTNPPLFLDANGWSNLRLQSNSPCINAGKNAFAGASAKDLDGKARVAGGTVDVGAYEFPWPTSAISYAWLQQYGFPIDGSADNQDNDSEGLKNWQEWVAGTNPTNAASALRILSLSNTSTGVAATWSSVGNRIYTLERNTRLEPASVFAPVRSNIVGRAASTTFTDTNTGGSGPFFYRVRVEP